MAEKPFSFLSSLVELSLGADKIHSLNIRGELEFRNQLEQCSTEILVFQQKLREGISVHITCVRLCAPETV